VLRSARPAVTPSPVNVEQLNALVPPLVAAFAVAWFALETVWPLSTVAPRGQRLRHLWRNGRVVLAGAVPNVVGGALLGQWLLWVHRHALGLLPQLPLPPWASIVITVLLIDAVDYFRHRLHHHWRPLWSLHQVHHLDEAVDVSTGYVSHPLEALPVFAVFGSAILVFGFDPVGYALRLLLGMVALGFHHSNVALPSRLDTMLSWVTPTPRTHRVHHARHAPLTDSNFGTIFTWWDRLFGTWRTLEQVESLETGLNAFGPPDARRLLSHPFQSTPAGSLSQ
jgi:sterol desaturase/sphingolipid hydroxylase (fatty acid hydroxylase superfamily)